MGESEAPAAPPAGRPGLTIEELARRGGVSPRTVRFYIAQGLLPGPGSRGKAATYGEEQLIRLRLIRRLTDRGVPLARLRASLSGLALEEARALLDDEDRGASELERAAESPSPRAYIASLLEQARTARGVAAQPPAPSPAPPAARSQPAAAAAPAPADTWRRWELAPGVELHVRADAERRSGQLIARLLDAARREGHDRPR
jgi:DNA-binding transcriptional MerR regulator